MERLHRGGRQDNGEGVLGKLPNSDLAAESTLDSGIHCRLGHNHRAVVEQACVPDLGSDLSCEREPAYRRSNGTERGTRDERESDLQCDVGDEIPQRLLVDIVLCRLEETVDVQLLREQRELVGYLLDCLAVLVVTGLRRSLALVG